MIAHKMTLELPVTILGREGSKETPGVATDAEGMSLEEFRKCFPEVPALSNGLYLHEDPTLPLASEDWGALAS